MKLEEKKRVEKSRRIREREGKKSLTEFAIVIIGSRSVLIKETRKIRKVVIIVIPDY